MNSLFYTPLQVLFKNKGASSGIFSHSGAYKKRRFLAFICLKIATCVKNELFCMQNCEKGRIKGARLIFLYAPRVFLRSTGAYKSVRFLRFICPPAYFRAVSAGKYPCVRSVAKTFSLFAVGSIGVVPELPCEEHLLDELFPREVVCLCQHKTRRLLEVARVKQ